MADLPSPPPPVLHPGTLKPVGPDDLAPLFPFALIMQEVTHRPRCRDPGAGARRVQAVAAKPALPGPAAGTSAADAGAHLLQYEGVSPAGSHKPNTAVAQAFYNKDAGIRKITTETGAGQWARRSHSRALCSVSTSRYSWCACRTTRSRIAASSWKRLARDAWPARRWRPTTAARSSRARPTATAVSALPFPRRSKWRRRTTIPSTRSDRC